MKLLNFILGVLGIVLVIGAFSSFLPWVFLGGITTGSITFAFGFPILLIILGAIMVYFGFYYNKSADERKGGLITIIKWGIICTIALLISNYILNKLPITNTFIEILFTSFIVSIVIQAVKSHDHEFYFKMKWFVFYFLVYANILWITSQYILPKITIQTGFFSSIVLGFALAGAMIIIQKINIRSNSIPWISIILILILLVANMNYLQTLTSIDFAHFYQSQNTSEISEENLRCPTPSSHPIYRVDVDSNSLSSMLNGLIDVNVWRIENDFSSCYMGKYKNQNPNWLYCDNLIVSRWDLSSSGTINYRWYTAVTAEWEPVTKGMSIYSLNKFACENGQKVSVEKGVTNYYVYDSRDGTRIQIKY